MKAHKSRPRHPRSLNQLLNRRLVSYASAATAAGAGLLGLARPAQAQIVYTPAHVVIGPRGSYSLDLTNDGATDFVLHDSITSNCSTLFSALLAKPTLANAVEGGTGREVSFAGVLNAGARIGSSQRFIRGTNGGVLMGEAIDSPGGGQYAGKWIHVVNRYLGLKFQINGETHFGWARMTVDFRLFKPLKSVLTGYAYQTQPNTPIIAGQEHVTAADASSEPRIKGESGPDASLESVGAPQPASLGILALGAAGLSAWRQEQPAAGL